MEKIKLYYDSRGNTLNVWFDDPKKEYSCEETGDEVILAKDKSGRVIGFEKLNFLAPSKMGKITNLKKLPVEVSMT